MWKLKSELVVIGMGVGVVCGCVGKRPVSPNSKESVSRLSPAQREAALRERVDQFWNAKVDENWDVLFEFNELARRDRAQKAAFVEWSQEKEPLVVHGFELQRVQLEGDLGWAEISYTSTARKFPKMEPRTTAMWHKWRFSPNDGTWFPIPPQILDSFPEAPAMRSAQDEQVLRERFDETWELRRSRDWAGLYEFTDPRDHERVSESDYADYENLFEYLDRNVQWVEVIGERGRVLVSYYHKLVDKAMEKIEPRDEAVIEKWVKYNGQWYRDLVVQ